MPRITLFVISFFLLFAANVRGEDGFRAGAATVDITPELGKGRVELVGYSARMYRKARGVHDRLTCAAVAVDDGKESAAVVTCDLLSISRRLREKVIERLAGTKYGDSNLMIAASHSHSGPGGYDDSALFKMFFGPYRENICDELADKIAEAVREADKAKEPVTVLAGETVIPDVVRNRRYREGGYDYVSGEFKGGKEVGFTDPTLTVIRFDGGAGTIAVLFHFAAHGTIIGPDNLEFSAEWPGAARRRIAASYPGAAVLYMNGAEGDQTPLRTNDGADAFTWVERIGERVGDAAVATLAGAVPVSAAPVRSAISRVVVDAPGRIMSLPIPAWLVRKWFPAITVQAIRLGEVALVGIPVEMTARPGAALKNSSRRENIAYPLVVGLANEFDWYCAAADEFDRGSAYEPGNTVYGAIEAGLIVGESLLLVDRIAEP